MHTAQPDMWHRTECCKDT